MHSPTNVAFHQMGFETIRRRWMWFVVMGVLYALLGVMALGSSVLMTMATMVFVGWLMIIGGVLQAAHAFANKEWGGFFVELLLGVLYAVVGLMIVANPAATAVTLTLVVAILLTATGVFRIVVGLTVPFHHRLWVLLNGVINVLLGISIWRAWPFSGLWVIGLFVGVDMVFNGVSLMMLGLAARRSPAAEAVPDHVAMSR